MEFEWDQAKREKNLERHAVDFTRASRIFEGRVFTVVDARRDYGEIRYITLGRIDDRIYTVVWKQRGEAIRLISARRANAKEVARYQAGAP